MISRKQWDALPDEKKFSWLLGHTALTEEAIGRLEAAILALRDRVTTMETASADNASKRQP
jgi:hypothetical protein